MPSVSNFVRMKASIGFLDHSRCFGVGTGGRSSGRSDHQSRSGANRTRLLVTIERSAGRPRRPRRDPGPQRLDFRRGELLRVPLPFRGHLPIHHAFEEQAFVRFPRDDHFPTVAPFCNASGLVSTKPPTAPASLWHSRQP